MGRIKVQWRSVGKVAGLAAVAMIALKVLPGTFAAPQAPPLAPDVGLAGVAIEQAPPAIEPEPQRIPKREHPSRPRPSRGVAPSRAVIRTTPRRHKPKPHPRRRSPTTPSAPSLSPEPVAPVSPPEAAPAPPAPQPAPEDGSMEFAPH